MTAIQPTNSESIRKMFGAIAGRYDRANTVLSFGTHYAWRKKLVRWSGIRHGQKVLDCASGTGDLAFEFEKTVGARGQVIGTDFCAEMLEFGKRKAAARRSGIQFQVADVMNLPFGSGNFDVTSIAFGIRNVSDPVKGLAEMGRVTRTGGTVMVLEFGQSRTPLWGSLFNFYSRRILPTLGGWVTGKKDAYEYLNHSASQFPCREQFLKLAEKTGLFSKMEYLPLMGGIAFIYRLQRRSDEGGHA